MALRKTLPALLLALALPFSAMAQETPPDVAAATYAGPTVYAAEVVTQYPHDQTAFTQGLLWHDGALFESTGQEGRSVVRKVDLSSGEPLSESAIPADQFGEGLALWEGELVSLTWRDGAIHRWNGDTLAHISSRTGYPLEGWGLTSGPEGLIHSDGSDVLRILDPETYEVRRSVPVTLNGRPLRRLNELEMIDGMVFANVWMTPFIVAIDPASGAVQKLIDLRAVVQSVSVGDGDAVLNAIAWDADNNRLFVTGKLWPTLFEIRLVETNARVG